MPTDSATFTKTRTQFLYRRHKTYYARGFANGKTVWKSLNADLYSAAVVRLPVALAEIKSGAETVVASKATTVGDLIELYLAQVFRTVGIKETTKHYRRQLFTKIRKEWAGVDALIPRKVTVQDTEEFANRLAGISSPTRYNNSIDSLRAVFAIGIDQGLLTKNPFAEVGKLKPRQKKLELPSTEAFTAILRTVRAQGAWCSRPVGDLIEFLAYTGCRLSEASNVRWEDVDFERDMLTIWTTKHARYEDSERRTLPLNKSLRNLLIDLRDNPRYFRNKEREGYVLAVTECEKALTRACRETETKRITHHDLRHLFATRCIESGIDIPTLSKWLGHKDGGALALKTYGHLRDDHSREMAKKLEF